MEKCKELLESGDPNLKFREPTANEVRQTLVSNLAMMVSQGSPISSTQQK